MPFSSSLARRTLSFASPLFVTTIGVCAPTTFVVLAQETGFGLPAETAYAPYSLGRAAEGVAQSFDEPTALANAANHDVIVFSVGGIIENYGQAEYKVTLQPGDVVHYSWTASDEIYYEFHGHPVRDGEAPIEALLYRDESGIQSHGALTAPIGGWHGWYFVNDSFDTPIEIELTLWGFYELTPGVVDTR